MLSDEGIIGSEGETVCLLRAFLAYNTEWKIHFFGNYAGFAFEEFIAEKMPLCRRDLGGSLYIQRV